MTTREMPAQRRALDAAAADAASAAAEFDDACRWFAAERARGWVEPLAAEVWVFDLELSRVLMVRHRHRGWVPPGGAVEPGETPREGAARELREETGLAVRLLARPAAATVRCYLPGLPPTLGVSYVALVDAAVPLAPEHGQPAAWLPLDRPWASCFPADRARMRAHAAHLAAAR
ncbi:NUDIX domain-containing protein [Kitasatospora sp. NPDC059646]|uniref:NUDIX domain-containing protein n=1 Tax=Kitasatospora sp. NPDC059646 TaxID=3346893 RepID=UPI0036B0D226